MDKTLSKVLAWTLKKLARFTISKYRPGIIGVTGSVGKTSTKLAIAAVLSGERKIRCSPESHNNQFGFPLAIIGEWPPRDLKLVSKTEPAHGHRVRKIFFWLKVIAAGGFQLVARNPDYPEVLVLEYGADAPGDIKYLLQMARPNIAVITAIGEIPVHVEFYSGPKEVAREKSRLIEYLPSAGFAVLNADDPTVTALKNHTRAHLMTFGFGGSADVKLTNFENRAEEGRPMGIAFKLGYGGGVVPVLLEGVFGRAQAYAAGASAAIGIIFGLNLVRISERLRKYRPASSRTEILSGIKDSYILDDSYNASPLSMRAALETLKDLPGRRKVAVLGDMLEIGKYAIEAHESLGKTVSKFVNILVAVGSRGKLIAASAVQNGMDRRRVKSFDTAEEAADVMPALVRKGDLILVKASRAMHLEEVVKVIASPPASARGGPQGRAGIS